MSESERARVGPLFEEAMNLPPEQRSAFLAEKCGEDSAMRAEVEMLLAMPESAMGDFLEVPPAVVAELRAADSTVPERIGDFKIIRVIGHGGMGVVYEATQINPKREVALKVIRPGLMSRGLLQRFQLESDLLGRLEHSGIARIYEAGTAQVAEAGHTDHALDQPYFAMELVHGVTLTEYVEQKRLGTRERMQLFADVCDAAHHAHQKGVIHRDLKPANILVTGDGQPKILDFGVARATDADMQTMTLQTDVGQLIGTVPYMSPEQVSGKSRDLDTRSDVYSLGVVLYELLSGHLPHDVRNRSIPEAARLIRDDEATRLSSVNPVLRGDIETIVAKALEKDKERRYQAAASLAGDIRRYLRDEPVIARPATAMYQFRKFAARNKALVAGVASTMLTLVVGALVAVLFAVQAHREKTVAERSAYFAGVGAAATAIDDHDMGLARRSLERCPASLRGWEWRHLWSRLDESLAVKSFAGPVVLALFVDESDQFVVWSTIDSLSYSRSLWDSMSGEVKSEIGRPDHAFRFVGSPEGLTDAWLSRDEPMLHIRRFPSEEIRSVSLASLGWSGAIDAAESGSPSQAPWIADFNGAAISDSGDMVAITWRVEEGFECAVTNLVDDTSWRASANYGRAPRFTRDGDWLILRGADRLDICETATGRKKLTVKTDVGCFDVSPDRSRIVTGSLDGDIVLWDASDGKAVARAHGHTGSVRSAVFSGGEPGMIATAGHDRGIRLWDAQTLAPRNTLYGHLASVISIAFNHDGSRLVTTSEDKTVRVWDTESGDTLVLRGHKSYVYPVMFLPGGSRIFSGGWDGFSDEPGSMRLWDADSGEPIAAWGKPGEYVLAADCSADGSRIVVSTNGSASGNRRLILFDAATARALAHTNVSYAQSVQFHPSGGFILSASDDGAIRVWDASRLTLTAVVREAVPAERQSLTASQCACSPDGTTIAVSKGGEIQILDVDTFEAKLTLEGHVAVVKRLAFSPDSRRLASASEDMTVRIWDCETGEIAGTLQHSAGALAVAFSPDGERIATGGRDALVRIWDARTYEEIVQLKGHDAYVYSLDFSPDGTRLVSGSGDHTVRIWETAPIRERVAARDEWRRFNANLGPRVRALFDELSHPNLVIERLNTDQTLSARAREVAKQIVLQQAIRRKHANDCVLAQSELDIP